VGVVANLSALEVVVKALVVVVVAELIQLWENRAGPRQRLTGEHTCGVDVGEDLVVGEEGGDLSGGEEMTGVGEEETWSGDLGVEGVGTVTSEVLLLERDVLKADEVVMGSLRTHPVELGLLLLHDRGADRDKRRIDLVVEVGLNGLVSTVGVSDKSLVGAGDTVGEEEGNESGRDGVSKIFRQHGAVNSEGSGDRLRNTILVDRPHEESLHLRHGGVHETGAVVEMSEGAEGREGGVEQ
jgi:hypothetical protein